VALEENAWGKFLAVEVQKYGINRLDEFVTTEPNFGVFFNLNRFS
jgi:hypothetical protein